MRFRESATAHNLLVAFSAESQARTRYNFFAARAREENFIQIARIFEETAEQEYEHALRFFKFFNGGEMEITGKFPSGTIEDTHSNLLSSAALELYVHGTMYRQFAETARLEGFERAAETFDAISVSERYHEKVFRELADNISMGRCFSRKEERQWKCLGCGYICRGEKAPDKCPACVRPQGYFELLGSNW